MVAIVSQWWFEQMDYRTKQLGDEQEARRQLIVEEPAGPAGHVQFAPLIREYWLACDALNGTLEKRDWLDPPKFLLGWLIRDRLTLPVETVASQPYWPMGLTKDGRWF
jgi:hypothetical protein